MTRVQRGVIGKLSAEQCTVVAANIRTLRQRKGWTQVKLGELMGGLSASTVCAAEGHRNDRQRSFTIREIEQLAAIFDISPAQLMTRCMNCGGHPPTGFACLACGAKPDSDHSDTPALTGSAQDTRAAVRG
jgi:transcriptional regulator with XRE-family HTH domain